MKCLMYAAVILFLGMWVLYAESLSTNAMRPGLRPNGKQKVERLASGNQKLTLPFEVQQVQLKRNAANVASFPGLETSWRVGLPALPWQSVKILLPPEADLSTVLISINDSLFEEVEGRWDVMPSLPPMGPDGPDWPKGRNIVNGRDLDVYAVDKLYPENPVAFFGADKMRQWQLAEAVVFIYRFNPVQKKLYYLKQGLLTVEYKAVESVKQKKASNGTEEKGKPVLVRKGHEENAGRLKLLEDSTINFDEANGWYMKSEDTQDGEKSSYRGRGQNVK